MLRILECTYVEESWISTSIVRYCTVLNLHENEYERLIILTSQSDVNNHVISLEAKNIIMHSLSIIVASITALLGCLMITESFELAHLSENLSAPLRLSNKKLNDRTGNFVSIESSAGNGNVEECDDGTLMSVSRRNAFAMAQKYSVSILMGYFGINSVDASYAVGEGSVRIASYPSLEYLEPIFELKLSVDNLAKGTQNKKLRPYILKRLEKFFRGGLTSERNYYSGLGIQYVNNISYDTDQELPEYIKLDKEQRLQAMESTLKFLEQLKQVLADDIDNDDLVMSNAQDASSSLQKWFDMIPTQDFEAVDQLFRSTRAADANRDGKLDDKELATMTETEREIWKKRVKLVGDYN